VKKALAWKRMHNDGRVKRHIDAANVQLKGRPLPDNPNYFPRKPLRVNEQGQAVKVEELQPLFSTMKDRVYHNLPLDISDGFLGTVAAMSRNESRFAAMSVQAAEAFKLLANREVRQAIVGRSASISTAN